MGMYKKVVGGAREMQAVLTDSLVLDAVPRVNSMNFVTSDAVARAIAGASGEVPQVTEQDNGKVLKAIYDEGGPAVEWGDATVVTNTPVSETTGHFDIGSEVPVKVNYKGTATGTSQQFVNVPIDPTKCSGVKGCVFDISALDISLGSDLTASLVIKEKIKLPGNAFGLIVGYAGDAFLTNTSRCAYMTKSPSTPATEQIDGEWYITPQTITISGQNPSEGEFDKYVCMVIESGNPTVVAESFDAARAAGSIEIQHWPKTAATGYEVSIEPQKQADWTETNNQSPSYVNHKPAIVEAIMLDYVAGTTYEGVWTSMLQAYRSGRNVYVKVPVASMAARADGKAYLNNGYMKLPLVSVIQESSTHWTATFAATDGSYTYKAVLDNDEDEITWKPTAVELDA